MANNTFEQNVAQLGSDLDNIKAALEDTHLIDMTGVKPAQYAQKISEMGEWVYPDEWRFEGETVDEILEEDTEDYPGKAIFVLDNIQNTASFDPYGLAAYKTSDNPTTLIQLPINTMVNISFNSTDARDIPDGRKIRWIMFYQANSNTTMNARNVFKGEVFPGLLYACLNCIGHVSTLSVFNDAYKLQYVTLKSGWNFPNSTNNFFATNSLKNKELSVSLAIDANSLFAYNPNIEHVNIIISQTLISCASAFYQCYNLRKISGICDMSQVSNVGKVFESCARLKTVKIKNLKASLNLSTCYSLSRESLIYLINNLQIITSGSQTLTLGTLNINKLTASEIAVGTNKGWVIV